MDLSTQQLETAEQKELGIVRGLVNSTRRWNTTPEIRQRALDRAVHLMDYGREEKTQLGAIKTIQAMERDNQTDEWHEQKLEVEAQKQAGPQVTIQANTATVTVSTDAIKGLLGLQRDMMARKAPTPTVIENTPSPCSSGQASEGQTPPVSQ